MIRAESYGVEATQLCASIREFDGPERAVRALKMAGPLLLGALLSLPIPAWHLIAVPGFLIASLVLGVRRLRQLRAIERVEGDCPACGRAQLFPVSTTASFPLAMPCPACGEFIKFSE